VQRDTAPRSTLGQFRAKNETSSQPPSRLCGSDSSAGQLQLFGEYEIDPLGVIEIIPSMCLLYETTTASFPGAVSAIPTEACVANRRVKHGRPTDDGGSGNGWVIRSWTAERAPKWTGRRRAIRRLSRTGTPTGCDPLLPIFAGKVMQPSDSWRRSLTVWSQLQFQFPMRVKCRRKAGREMDDGH
jgi:hypothetical protein